MMSHNRDTTDSHCSLMSFYFATSRPLLIAIFNEDYGEVRTLRSGRCNRCMKREKAGKVNTGGC